MDQKNEDGSPQGDPALDFPPYFPSHNVGEAPGLRPPPPPGQEDPAPAQPPVPPWLRSLATSSLVREPPADPEQRQLELAAYVELFVHFASDTLVDDIGPFIRCQYPRQHPALLDDVLAVFVLQHPEHAHAVLHALLSCVIDGSLPYSPTAPPFPAFLSLFSPSEANGAGGDLSHLPKQHGIACAEMLRVLTHYNRPVNNPNTRSAEASADGSGSSSCSREGDRSPPSGDEPSAPSTAEEGSRFPLSRDEPAAGGSGSSPGSGDERSSATVGEMASLPGSGDDPAGTPSTGSPLRPSCDTSAGAGGYTSGAGAGCQAGSAQDNVGRGGVPMGREQSFYQQGSQMHRVNHHHGHSQHQRLTQLHPMPHRRRRRRLGKVSGSSSRRTPARPLTAWITDCLLAAPLDIRSDYFRWCGGVMGKYAAGAELRPPSTVAPGSRGPGKHPQLQPSTPRWAVANGAAVILHVCDDEVLRYDTAELSVAAVPALLLPPPATGVDEHLIQGLPPLEPFARLFHRYYALASPGATQRLLLGLLEAPPSWAPDALDAAVQLVELLRAAEDSHTTVELPPMWLYLHFLRPMGAAMGAAEEGVAADAACALLFRLFSQPALVFPPLGQAQGKGKGQEHHMQSDKEKSDADAAALANEEMTARGLASLMQSHGTEVEWRVCALWEAALGLLPLDPSSVALPELVTSTPLQPPVLSWALFRPLLRVFDHLPPGAPSHACLRRIFSATVTAILERSFPATRALTRGSDPSSSGPGFLPSHHEGPLEGEPLRGSQAGGGGAGARSVGMAELRALVHHLFTNAVPGPDLAAQLLADLITCCLSYDCRGTGGEGGALGGERSPKPLSLPASPATASGSSWGVHASAVNVDNIQGQVQTMLAPGQNPFSGDAGGHVAGASTGFPGTRRRGPGGAHSEKERGATATVDSYIVASVCALACQTQMGFFMNPALNSTSQDNWQNLVARVGPTPSPVSGVAQCPTHMATTGIENPAGGSPGVGVPSGVVRDENPGARGVGESAGPDGKAEAAAGTGGSASAEQGKHRLDEAGAELLGASGVPTVLETSHRLLSLLQTFLTVVPASLAFGVPSPASGEDSHDIVAAAVVAAHISKLLGKSRVCWQGLATIRRCRWDATISSKASTVVRLVEENFRAAEQVITTARLAAMAQAGGGRAAPMQGATHSPVRNAQTSSGVSHPVTARATSADAAVTSAPPEPAEPTEGTVQCQGSTGAGQGLRPSTVGPVEGALGGAQSLVLPEASGRTMPRSGTDGSNAQPPAHVSCLQAVLAGCARVHGSAAVVEPCGSTLKAQGCAGADGAKHEAGAERAAPAGQGKQQHKPPQAPTTGGLDSNAAEPGLLSTAPGTEAGGRGEGGRGPLPESTAQERPLAPTVASPAPVLPHSTELLFPASVGEAPVLRLPGGPNRASDEEPGVPKDCQETDKGGARSASLAPAGSSCKGSSGVARDEQWWAAAESHTPKHKGQDWLSFPVPDAKHRRRHGEGDVTDGERWGHATGQGRRDEEGGLAKAGSGYRAPLGRTEASKAQGGCISAVGDVLYGSAGNITATERSSSNHVTESNDHSSKSSFPGGPHFAAAPTSGSLWSEGPSMKSVSPRDPADISRFKSAAAALTADFTSYDPQTEASTKARSHSRLEVTRGGHGGGARRALPNVGTPAVAGLLARKPLLALAAVPILWRRLVTAPECAPSTEGTSSHKGWGKLIDALCSVVYLIPASGTAAILAKAGTELLPWTIPATARLTDDNSADISPSGGKSHSGKASSHKNNTLKHPATVREEDLRSMGFEAAEGSEPATAQLLRVWVTNTRVVTLLAELLRMASDPVKQARQAAQQGTPAKPRMRQRLVQAVYGVANSTEVLMRATDGMAVDGEACTLPQLELLEAAVAAASRLASPSSSGSAPSSEDLWATARLLLVIKARIPAIVFCLSHCSALVKALSTSLLRQVLSLDVKLPPQLIAQACGDCSSTAHIALASPCEPGQPGSLSVHPLTPASDASVGVAAAQPDSSAASPVVPWQYLVQQCIFCEARFRLAKGLCTAPLASAASALGCAVAV